MAKNTQAKTKSGSTQKFTEIQEVAESVVLLKSGAAALVIEIQATNFALLSKEEQDAKIYGYASFLNSLSFSIQVVVRNKKIDISSYINSLSHQIENPKSLHANLSDTQNQLLVAQIKLYRDFVQELVKVNTVLEKKFYIVIPYSPLEKGVTSAGQTIKKQAGSLQLADAKSALSTKADSVLGQLGRLGLRAKVLENEELIRMLYDVYNQQGSQAQMGSGENTPIISTQTQV